MNRHQARSIKKPIHLPSTPCSEAIIFRYGRGCWWKNPSPAFGQMFADDDDRRASRRDPVIADGRQINQVRVRKPLIDAPLVQFSARIEPGQEAPDLSANRFVDGNATHVESGQR